MSKCIQLNCDHSKTDGTNKLFRAIAFSSDRILLKLLSSTGSVGFWFRVVLISNVFILQLCNLAGCEIEPCMCTFNKKVQCKVISIIFSVRHESHSRHVMR